MDIAICQELTHGDIQKNLKNYIFFTLPPSLSAMAGQVGKAGGLQIPRYQGIAVDYYSFTLDALTLKSSGFCNVGVNKKYFSNLESKQILYKMKA